MTAEQRILAWLEHADFNGRGCWHSQDTIAAATGCCKRTVIRCVAKLEHAGRLDVERAPRGSRRCNVYRVKHWSPHKRAGVLNVLAGIREARRAECHSKRTATAPRAQTPPSAPSPRCSEAKDQRCGRAREPRCEDCGFPISEGGVCQNCAELESKLQNASDELVDAYETIKAQGTELRKLRRLETELNEASPSAKLVREVLDHWAKDHPRANVSLNGARAKLVRGAIRLGHTSPKVPCPVHPDDGSRPDRDARCTIADELIEAVEFLRLKPFVGPRGRTGALEPGVRRFDDLKYALADEKGTASEAKIEKCRREVRALRASRSERLWAAFRLASNVENAWFNLCLYHGRANGNGNGRHE